MSYRDVIAAHQITPAEQIEMFERLSRNYNCNIFYKLMKYLLI